MAVHPSIARSLDRGPLPGYELRCFNTKKRPDMNITQYLLGKFRTLRGMTIVHVGAHLAEEGERYQKYGARRVVWIEADPGIFEKLLERLDQLREKPRGLWARITGAPPTEHIAINALVGEEEGADAKLNVYDNNGASNSVFLIDRDNAAEYAGLKETGEVISLKFRRLDALLTEEGLSSDCVDILVVDVQGAELLCLKGAIEVLKSVRYIEAEVSKEPVYSGGVLLHELEAWLTQQNFERKTKVEKKHTDAIFERVR
jgi:FkbM family methyltransferase